MNSPSSHAGLLVPLDMFRITQLAGMFGELLAGKARNVLDAKLVVTRHVEAPLLLMRIVGSVTSDGPAKFWRENVDIVQMVSRGFPRQVIMFYADPGATADDRREGFIVAQQGQMVASDDAGTDRIPTSAPDADWPVSKLCEQLRIDRADLLGDFAGGAEVAVNLIDPTGDDQELLQQLFAQEMAAEAGEPDADSASPAPSASSAPRTPATSSGPLQADPSRRGAPSGPGPAKPDAAALAAEDLKRRAREHAAEAEAAAVRAAQIQAGLRVASDDLGLTVALDAEMSEPDQLQRFIVAKVSGDLPEGLGNDLARGLQGKRIDIAVKVDFLSEVFVENTPLSRSRFDAAAQERTLGKTAVRIIEVLGPRLGYGSLVSTGRAPHVFVSRKPELPLPEALIAEMLG